MTQNFGLGRGLSSLIPQKEIGVKHSSEDTYVEADSSRSDTFKKTDDMSSVRRQNKDSDIKHVVQSVAVKNIVANPHQPRLSFDNDALNELSVSIKEHGLMQPLVVSTEDNIHYEIIAGERRFRASQLAGLDEISVIVRDASEQDKMELALIENVQRADLNVIEEAKAYKKLIEAYDLSQEEVAKRIGKSRSVIANRLRLLILPATILMGLREGSISEGHAKVILSLDDTEAQYALYKIIVEEKLTVRQTTVRLRLMLHKKNPRKKLIQTAILPTVAHAQKTLQQALDTRITVTPRGRGGSVVIDYYEPEDLRLLVNKITHQ